MTAPPKEEPVCLPLGGRCHAVTDEVLPPSAREADRAKARDGMSFLQVKQAGDR